MLSYSVFRGVIAMGCGKTQRYRIPLTIFVGTPFLLCSAEPIPLLLACMTAQLCSLISASVTSSNTPLSPVLCFHGERLRHTHNFTNALSAPKKNHQSFGEPIKGSNFIVKCWLDSKIKTKGITKAFIKMSIIKKDDIIYVRVHWLYF